VDGLTWEYLHLISNPFPVVLVVTGTLVGVGGWISGREDLEGYGILSLLLGGVLAVPVYVTGLSAADFVEQRTFVTPSRVQTHRFWATWTTVLLLANGCFAAFALLEKDRRLRRFVLAVGTVAAVLAGYVGWLGGRISHAPDTLDRADAASPSAIPAARAAAPPAALPDRPAADPAPILETAPRSPRDETKSVP